MERENGDSNPPMLPAGPCLTGTPDERLDRMERRIISMHGGMSELKGALVGNDALGHKGLVGRMERVEKAVDGHDKKLLTWGGIITGAMAAFEFLRHKMGG